MSYQDFAIILSVIVLVEYATLLWITVRRAHFRDRRLDRQSMAVITNARFFEGPVMVVLFLVALGVTLSSIFIGSPNYAAVAGLVIAAARGGLFCLGVWLLRWYWQQRATWR